MEIHPSLVYDRIATMIKFLLVQCFEAGIETEPDGSFLLHALAILLAITPFAVLHTQLSMSKSKTGTLEALVYPFERLETILTDSYVLHDYLTRAEYSSLIDTMEEIGEYLQWLGTEFDVTIVITKLYLVARPVMQHIADTAEVLGGREDL